MNSASGINKALIFRGLSGQSGIGLPAAIFVITLMAAIAVAVNNLVTQNAQTYQEEINLTRAFYAAESGVGFVMNTIYPPEDYPSYTVPLNCPASRSYSFSVDGLNNCTADVVCSSVIVGTAEYATIESTGTCDGVQRTVQVRTAY